MSLFTVDATKCMGDGVCAAECPIKIIAMDKNPKIPVPVDGAEKVCINCGHCVAVCPYGALSLNSMPVESCAPLKAGLNLTPEKMEQLLKGRRSVRVYGKKVVEQQVLENIIDIARYAPSGINRQPVRWLIINNKEKVNRLAELTVEWMRGLIVEKSPLAVSYKMENLVYAWDKGEDRICRGAPAAIIAYGIKDDRTAAQACTIALTYAEIAAVSFNLGICWAGYVNFAIQMSENVKKFIAIPDKAQIFGVLLVGYPRYSYHRIPHRNKPQIKIL